MNATENTTPDATSSTDKPAQARKRRGKPDKLPDTVKMAEGRAEQITAEMATSLKDDEGMAATWAELVLGGKVMSNGKQRLLVDVMKNIRAACRLPSDMTTAQVRSQELELGNILAVITAELGTASYGHDLYSERKKDYLATASDRRKTKDAIESELSATNEEYRYVRGIWLSASLNKKFWSSMHDMVMGSLDRLRHVGITLATEAKVDRNMNQDVPNRTGTQI